MFAEQLEEDTALSTGWGVDSDWWLVGGGSAVWTALYSLAEGWCWADTQAGWLNSVRLSIGRRWSESLGRLRIAIAWMLVLFTCIVTLCMWRCSIMMSITISCWGLIIFRFFICWVSMSIGWLLIFGITVSWFFIFRRLISRCFVFGSCVHWFAWTSEKVEGAATTWWVMYFDWRSLFSISTEIVFSSGCFGGTECSYALLITSRSVSSIWASLSSVWVWVFIRTCGFSIASRGRVCGCIAGRSLVCSSWRSICLRGFLVGVLSCIIAPEYWNTGFSAYDLRY